VLEYPLRKHWKLKTVDIPDWTAINLQIFKINIFALVEEWHKWVTIQTILIDEQAMKNSAFGVVWNWFYWLIVTLVIWPFALYSFFFTFLHQVSLIIRSTLLHSQNIIFKRGHFSKLCASASCGKMRIKVNNFNQK
jgi:hypothetical protein